MDEAIFYALNGAAAVAPVRWAAVALSSRWMLAVVGAPIALWLLRQRRWVAVLSVALSVGAANHLSAEILKPWVDRPRPCHAAGGLPNVVAIDCGPGRSFPSAHAANAFALVVAAAPLVPKGWLLLLPIAGLVALSRVVLGVHYPSDILAGAGLGALLGALAIFARAWLSRRSAGPPVDGD